MSEVVGMLILDSKTYKIYYSFNQPLKFDQEHYNYFLNILNVRFSNVVPNVSSTYAFEFTVGGTTKSYPNMFVSGIYEISDLINIFNNSTGMSDYLKLELDDHTGRIKMTNLSASTITFTNLGLLAEDIMGKFEVSSLSSGDYVISSKVPVISSYNYFILNSNTVRPVSYISDDTNNTLITTCALYSFSSAINAFGYKDFCSMSENSLSYRLGMDYMQDIDFSLVGSDGKELSIIDGAVSDFNICCSIVKMKKI